MISRMTLRRFTVQDRLRSGADFARVYHRRRSASDAILVVYVCENPLPHARIGLSVSRKVGNAVVRNRWKRLLREAFRLSRAELPKSIDIVVIPRVGVEPALEPLMASLTRLAERATERLKRD